MSLNAKATNNLGWIKASDVKALKHTLINKTSEKKSIKGNGKGTRMAWGGKQDTIHASMASHKGKTFHVNMKEAVGNGTWYRGKIEGKGANVWLKSNQVEAIKITESKTSLLGHINSSNVEIFKTLGGSSFKAGSTYTNKVYYIKKQAKYGNDTYYQMSRHHTGTQTLGWIKSSDVRAEEHLFVGRPSDKLSIKGTGKGTSFAWGGKQDAIHSSMSKLKGKLFHLNMEEKVGNTTWYRGKIEGKGPNVWLSANQVEKVAIKESKTSLLGHINSAQVNVYKEPGGKAAFKAGEKHTNKVYYIKKQAKYGNDTYYQMSRHHTGTQTLGWIKSSDVRAEEHLFVGRPSDKLSIKGTGKGTSFAWGGKQDAIHSSMSKLKGK